MNGMPFGLIVEAMVAILLVATIAYCIVVNRKLNRLRAEQANLKDIIRSLDNSTRNAENVIGHLRETVQATQEDLGGRIETARSISGKLKGTIGNAEAMLEKINTFGRVTKARTAGQTHAEGSVKVRLNPKMRLKNLMAGDQEQPKPDQPQKPASAKKQKVA